MNEYFERALKSQFGIKILVPEDQYHAFIGKLYAARKLDPRYQEITISQRINNWVFLVHDRLDKRKSSAHETP